MMRLHASQEEVAVDCRREARCRLSCSRSELRRDARDRSGLGLGERKRL